jgi:hydroxylamine reductase (hybrid-cluster protein)
MLDGGETATLYGRLGSRWITDTTAFTGNWGIIECMTDCAFTTLTSGTRPDGATKLMLGTLDAKTLTKGQRIYGHFTAITLASGSVIAYEGAKI